MDVLHYTLHKVELLLEITTLKLMVAVVFGVGSFLFGDLYTDGLVAILVLMILDAIFGIAASKYEHAPITSKRGMRGIIKGAVYFSAISAAHFADLTIPFDIVQSAMIAFVGVNEFISILENIGRLGYRTPQKLLNQLKDKYQ